MKYLLTMLLAVVFLYGPANAQEQHHEHHLHGIVVEVTEEEENIPLPGANVYWAGTTIGTATGEDGFFHLEMPENGNRKLVVSYIGYKNDTIDVENMDEPLLIGLSVNKTLEEVQIIERAPGSHISKTDPIFTQQITAGELQKAACCNLSESFETNASVDVSYSDAVTGAKHIKLLSLAGKYSQLQTENIPNLRGLAIPYGLTYIPGTWMQSIQVSKGAASVKNGYESTTGQINIEYKKPDNDELLFMNLFVNHAGRIEGNANGSVKLNDRWSTAWFLHANNRSVKHDRNNDGFLDMPLMNHFQAMNRWKYENSGKMHAQFGVKYLTETRRGGQLDFDINRERIPENPYGTNVETRRLEIFSKSAVFSQKRAATNVGWINSFTWHDMNTFFGLTDYDAIQMNYYSNLMFQSYIGNTNHTYTTGVSYIFDRYDENLNDSSMLMVEHIPGAFFEYTWTNPDKFTLLLGIRADYHNIYGAFFTPRIHFKYDITPTTIARLSAGKGYRTPHAIAENISYLASSREWVFREDLKMEEAWNYGLNLIQYVYIHERELSISAEFYRTDFVNQAILDRDIDNNHIYIYNLDGRSYANTFQVEAKFEVIPRLDLVAAFRLNDVHATTAGKLQRETMVDRYKGLLSLSYQTRMHKWQFDATAQFNGQSRLPYTGDNPEPYRRPDTSPSYTIINAQVTKFFKRWDLYVGGENLTNFVQTNPIIAADDPFSEYFDASQVWGPILGIKVYAGARFKLSANR